MLAFFRNHGATCFFACLDFLIFLAADSASSGSLRTPLAAASRNFTRWLFGGGGLAGLCCLCLSLSLFSPDLGLRLGSKIIEQIRCIFAA